MQDLSLSIGTLVHAKAQVSSHQRFYPVEEEVIQPGASLPTDFDNVFKASCRDQSHAGALALQKRVGADSRAVQKNDVGLRGNLRNGFGNRLRRV